jgi:cystathionine beta-lyase/cystathionine gamma-synthase
MMSRLKKNPQTALVHAPRQAPQYISTVQPPLYRASTIIFKDTDALFNRHWTDDYDYSYGTHGTPPPLHWAITLHKLRVEPTAYWHQVVYLPST